MKRMQVSPGTPERRMKTSPRRDLRDRIAEAEERVRQFFEHRQASERISYGPTPRKSRNLSKERR